MFGLGNPIVPTPPAGDSSNRVADTEFVTNAIASATGPLTPFPTPSGTGSIIYWSGTSWIALAGNSSATAFLSESASGTPSWAALSAVPGALVSISNFTASGIYTATIATGAKQGYVKLWGAPAGNTVNGGQSFGGGGPGYLEKLLTGLTGGNTLALTLGTAGTDGIPGAAGGTSTLSSGSQSISTLTANGGGAPSATGGGSGGTAFGGDINLTGQNGMYAQGGTPSPGVSGGGFTGVGCIIQWLT